MFIRDALRIRPGDVVTLVGGGGKTTVMFRLAQELTGAGLTVISTMTTKIFVGQMALAPASLLLEPGGAVPPALAGAAREHRHVVLGGRIGVDREKVEGVGPEVVDWIAGHGLADVIVVEADGSRRLPLKAPAEHEPVVPPSTTVLAPLVGLDVLGQPLDAAHVHRPELVAGLATAQLGEPVTPEIVARVLAHLNGGAKGLPDGARLTPFLNKGEERRDDGREIARLLIASPLVDEVLIGAAETAEPVSEVWGRVAAVVLAAGQASRFGALKQVLPWHGTPLVAHVAQQALSCRDIAQVVVATGAEPGRVEQAINHDATFAQGNAQQRLVIVDVPDWAEGQSRSVRTGLRTAEEAAVGRLSAVLFLLADQPGVSPELLSALIQRHRETLAPVVAPRYEGRRGNPVLFDRSTFREFAELTGDAGARSLLARHRERIAWVEWPNDDILRDIDTPEDYTAAQ